MSLKIIISLVSKIRTLMACKHQLSNMSELIKIIKFLKKKKPKDSLNLNWYQFRKITTSNIKLLKLCQNNKKRKVND